MTSNADTPLWTPSPERVTSSNLTAFTALSRSRHADIPQDYESLHSWSVANKETFWELIWDYFGIQGVKGSPPYLSQPSEMPGAKWFPQGQLNFAENLLRQTGQQPAIIATTETGSRTALSWDELRERVAQLAEFLKKQGVTKGDRVAGFLPNCADSVIGMLATTSLGAVWSSCSPDFGVQGVIDRFGQIEPKVLLACNGYYYNGKTIDSRARIKEITSTLGSLQALVWIPFVATIDCRNQARSDIAEFVSTQDIFTETPAPALEFVPCRFDDPLYIMYSSGTTGVPKCIVHGVGGTLLQHVKELGLHTDLRNGDRIFYFTTCGWMMWNWLVSSLALGATLVLYDGSPFYPQPSALFDLAEKENIRIFGAGAKFYTACDKAGLEPVKTHNLTHLDTLLSTGSPLPHEAFEYLYRCVKQDVCVSSISGGTDIVSCFALGNPSLPVYRGELQCIGLGMDVRFADDDGNDLQEGRGELVCRSPFPSMPIGFWNDPDGKKYHSAYFDRFPGVWAHGDFGEFIYHQATNVLPAQNGVVIHGRSDAVLNPGGVRIGTAEIYRQVEKLDFILESLAVGQQWENDERIILFVRTRDNQSLNEDMEKSIREIIRKNTTPRHVPARIVAVPDIPRTISGKIVELAVKKIIHGEEVKNKDALANPEALEYFRDLKQLTS